MSQITFKQFLRFVELPEDASDEQITEIFGIFRNNERVNALKAKKKALVQQKVDALRARNAERKPKSNDVYNPLERGSLTMRSQQAAGRAAERDWIANMATEGLSKKLIDKFGGEDVWTFIVGEDDFARKTHGTAADICAKILRQYKSDIRGADPEMVAEYKKMLPKWQAITDPAKLLSAILRSKGAAWDGYGLELEKNGKPARVASVTRY